MLDFLYHQHNYSDNIVCKIEVNTIMKVLVPLEFEYQGPMDIFNSDFDSNYEQLDSDVQYVLKQDIKVIFK